MDNTLQGLCKASVSDPVMLLDEIDKMGSDSVRGNPAAALLEVICGNMNCRYEMSYL